MKCLISLRNRRIQIALLLIICQFGMALPAFAQSRSEPGLSSASLEVYKKWIGASGDEANVEIHLSCGGGITFPTHFINDGQPAGWEINDVPQNGLICDVRETMRPTFVSDYKDCINLRLIPGQAVECTMVNTKVVKKIEMLNRYGLILMISVMLGAGLAAVKRFSPI